MGAMVSVHIKSKTMEVKKKGEQGIFVGNNLETKGCQVYIKRLNKIVVSQYVQLLQLKRDPGHEPRSRGDR